MEWYLRAGTIRPELVARPLDSFLVSEAAAVYDTTSNTIQTEMFSDPPLGVNVQDSMETKPGALLQSGSLDRMEDASFAYFDVHYSNASQLGVVTSGVGAVMITYVPEYDEYVEVVISQSRLHSAGVQFAADTTAGLALASVRSTGPAGSGYWGKLRAEHASVSRRGQAGSEWCTSPDAFVAAVEVMAASSNEVFPGSVLAKDPCVGPKSALVASAAGLVAWSVGGMFCAVFCQAALPFIGKGAATNFVGVIGAAAGAVYCVRSNGGPAIRSTGYAWSDSIPPGRPRYTRMAL